MAQNQPLCSGHSEVCLTPEHWKLTTTTTEKEIFIFRKWFGVV